jgi:hypothetical protein
LFLRCRIFFAHFLALVWLCIDVASKAGEFLVRFLFLSERFVQKRDMIRLAKFLRESDHCAVTSDFVMLDTLRGSDEGIKKPKANGHKHQTIRESEAVREDG